MEELRNTGWCQEDQDLADAGVKMRNAKGQPLNPDTYEEEREPGTLWPEAPLGYWEEQTEEDRQMNAKLEKAVRVAGRALILALADTALAMMILGGKIDLAYGLLFLAGTSAFLGAKVENARM